MLSLTERLYRVKRQLTSPSSQPNTVGYQTSVLNKHRYGGTIAAHPLGIEKYGSNARH